MQNSRLNEAQAGTKIAGRNINNFRYEDDTILMAESEEELKSLLMKMKEESEKAGLKLNIQKMKIMTFGPNTSSQIGGETVRDFIFLGPQITADVECSPEQLNWTELNSTCKLNKQGDSFDVLLSQFGTSLLFHVQF